MKEPTGTYEIQAWKNGVGPDYQGDRYYMVEDERGNLYPFSSYERDQNLEEALQFIREQLTSFEVKEDSELLPKRLRHRNTFRTVTATRVPEKTPRDFYNWVRNNPEDGTSTHYSSLDWEEIG